MGLFFVYSDAVFELPGPRRRRAAKIFSQAVARFLSAPFI
jgi:hypothetical protein